MTPGWRARGPAEPHHAGAVSIGQHSHDTIDRRMVSPYLQNRMAATTCYVAPTPSGLTELQALLSRS